MPYDEAKAEQAVRFIRHLRHTQGRQFAGQPFSLLPWQEHEVIRPLFGTVREDGTRQYRTCYVEVPKKNGKALALDTPIPTPAGWTTMGELRPGDEVFDEFGRPCRVIAATEPMLGRSCYAVTFCDGVTIIADAEHGWLTQTQIPYKVVAIRTTHEIAQRVRVNPANPASGFNHKIPLAPAVLDLPEAELPVDPYVLGVWLGDGRHDCAQIAVGDGDVATNPSLQEQLRDLGVLGRKHIPPAYLRASPKQRFVLLQGLMDTDGYVSAAGQCEFTTTSPALRDGVVELLRSLGFKPYIGTARASLNGKDCGEKYRVSFFAFSDTPVFRLERKRKRQKARPKRRPRSLTRVITKVEPVPSVPVRCIQVDNLSGLFLAGPNMVVTHNSELAAAVVLKLLCADGETGAEVYGAAADRSQASKVFDAAAQMVRQSPALSARCRIVESTKRIVYRPTASVFRALSADVKTKHGMNIHGVVADELHAWEGRRGRALWSVLTQGATAARLQPLTFIITTAGNTRNSVCWEVHEYARKVKMFRDGKPGGIDDPTFLPVLYGLDETDDWHDEANWAKANPSLGHTLTLEALRSEYRRVREIPSLQNDFRQLRLNQWVSQVTRFLPMDLWNATAGRVMPARLVGRTCYAGLDLASTTDVAALVLVFPMDDGTYQVLPYFWIPGDNIKAKSAKDNASYEVWVDQGYIEATEGDYIDYEAIRRTLEELSELYRIAEVAYDDWGSPQLVQQLQHAGFTVKPVRQGYRSLSPPTKELMTLVVSRRLVHGANPVLDWMADNLVVERDAAGNVKPSKEKASQKIDGMVALIMALDMALRNEGTGRAHYEDHDILVG